MGERFQKDDGPARSEDMKGGPPRGDNFVNITQRGALWFPLAVETDLADDISPAPIKETHIRFTGNAPGEEETAAWAPVADLFANGIRGIDVNEEVEPAFFSRPGKEQ
jgi:hypothetical protein